MCVGNSHLKTSPGIIPTKTIPILIDGKKIQVVSRVSIQLNYVIGLTG